tara:strand:+ start:48 stop:767 length:720 start_codon:yes stop_codon:yes gene_type:complete
LQDKINFSQIPAIILSGGLGKRIRGEIGEEIPKPMAPINGKPFLEHLLRYIMGFGIEEVILLCGYKHNKIVEYFQDGSKLNLKIGYSIEKKPLGTGGAIINALDKIQHDKFIVFNGDSIFKANLQKFVKHHFQKKNVATLALKEIEDCSRYGSAIMRRGKIIKYVEKNNNSNGVISAGVYLLEKNVLSNFFESEYPLSFEYDIIPYLIENKNLSGKIMEGDFIDIGIPETYRIAGKFVV